MSLNRAARRLVALPSDLRQSILLAPSCRHLTTTTTPTSTPPKSSVSETETSHFSALASTWWDPHGSSRILHLMNPFRHEFIYRCETSVPLSRQINRERPYSPQHPKRYLDIGCGGGIFAESAARISASHSVVGVDPTEQVIDVARLHARRDPALAGRLKYVNSAVEDLQIPATAEQGFDVVSLFEVVEHIRDPAPFLANCLRLVRPGGWFIGSTISRTWSSWFTTKVMAEDVMRVVPRGTHEWSQYIDASEMQGWARKQAGWGDWRVMGVVYVPGLGWKEVTGSEGWGNYFFGIRRLE